MNLSQPMMKMMPNSIGVGPGKVDFSSLDKMQLVCPSAESPRILDSGFDEFLPRHDACHASCAYGNDACEVLL